MSEPTSSSGETGPGDEQGAPQIDWSGLFDEWSKFGQELLDRFSDRAKTSSDLARQGKYGRNEWLDDMLWFWQNLGPDAARSVQICRDKLTRS